MSRQCPEHPSAPDRFPADVLLRQDPEKEEDEEEDGDDGKEHDDDNEESNDGYSE